LEARTARAAVRRSECYIVCKMYNTARQMHEKSCTLLRQRGKGKTQMAAKLNLEALKPYLLGAALGGLAAVVLGHILPCPVPLKRNAKGAYVLAVRIKLVPGTLDAFKARWAALAAVCRSSAEPNCLSYELCVAEDDPNTLLIHERYVSREDLSITHRGTAAFKAFGKWLNEESGQELLGDGRKTIVRAARACSASPPSLRAGPLTTLTHTRPPAAGAREEQHELHRDQPGAHGAVRGARGNCSFTS
jgi:quinol monooxygenase YgiN